MLLETGRLPLCILHVLSNASSFPTLNGFNWHKLHTLSHYQEVLSKPLFVSSPGMEESYFGIQIIQAYSNLKLIDTEFWGRNSDITDKISKLMCIINKPQTEIIWTYLTNVTMSIYEGVTNDY